MIIKQSEIDDAIQEACCDYSGDRIEVPLVYYTIEDFHFLFGEVLANMPNREYEPPCNTKV